MFSRLSLLLSAILAPSAFATEHTISSAVELARLSDSLAPGDVVILSDGTWRDQRLAFAAKRVGDGCHVGHCLYLAIAVHNDRWRLTYGLQNLARERPG